MWHLGGRVVEKSSICDGSAWGGGEHEVGEEAQVVGEVLLGDRHLALESENR